MTYLGKWLIRFHKFCKKYVIFEMTFSVNILVKRLLADSAVKSLNCTERARLPPRRRGWFTSLLCQNSAVRPSAAAVTGTSSSADLPASLGSVSCVSLASEAGTAVLFLPTRDRLQHTQDKHLHRLGLGLTLRTRNLQNSIHVF